eukprot:2870619-Prymnesium_polylepis.3
MLPQPSDAARWIASRSCSASERCADSAEVGTGWKSGSDCLPQRTATVASEPASLYTWIRNAKDLTRRTGSGLSVLPALVL